MNKADKLFIEVANKIKTEGYKDIDPRPHYADGTPAFTTFINPVVHTYDISKGELPIITLRPIAFKTSVRELLAIYQNQSNKISEFERMGVNWWKEWELEDGTIGRSYPYNLESHRPYEMKKIVKKVKVRLVDSKYKEIKHIENVNREFQGVGYLGETTACNFIDEEKTILFNLWKEMIEECYENGKLKFDNIFVHNDWHCFDTFLNDVRYLPQYFLAREDNFEGWTFTNRYYDSNGYSKDTCVFLQDEEYNAYRGMQGRCYKITDRQTGKVFCEIGIANVDRIGLGDSVRNILKKGNSDQRYIAQNIEPEDGYIYRYELSRNQMVNLLEDLVKNPYSRRHIISFWNWANIDKKALVECAYETVWTVRGEYLDMVLRQRSSDFCMAFNINEMQYVSFLIMVARHCGYKPGKFTHDLINVHIYDRHMEGLDEMLNREPIECSPVLTLNPDKKDFFNFTADDIKITGYESCKPQIKFEIAI